MLFFALIFQFIFSAGALPPQAISFSNCEKDFFKACYQTIDTLMVGDLFADFKQQIRIGCSGTPQDLHNLLLQLPFEPDNLRTEDCTFSACCNALMLNDYCTTQNNELLDILAHIAVLTYFRHSVSFFADVFIPVLDACVQSIGANLGVKTYAAYFRDFGNSESKDFYIYKKNILTKLANYIASKQIPILPNSLLKIAVIPNDEKATLHIAYKKTTSRGQNRGENIEDFDHAGLKHLVTYLQQGGTPLVEVNRTFSNNLAVGGTEGGNTLLYEWDTGTNSVRQTQRNNINYDLRQLNPTTQKILCFQNTHPPITAPSALTPGSAQCLPALVLQIPATRFNGTLTDKYFTDSEKIGHDIRVHQDLVIRENATKHAVCTTFCVAATQDTWFSASRGLRPSPALPQATIDYWLGTIPRNFEILYNLTRQA